MAARIGGAVRGRVGALRRALGGGLRRLRPLRRLALLRLHRGKPPLDRADIGRRDRGHALLELRDAWARRVAALRPVALGGRCQPGADEAAEERCRDEPAGAGPAPPLGNRLASRRAGLDPHRGAGRRHRGDGLRRRPELGRRRLADILRRRDFRRGDFGRRGPLGFGDQTLERSLDLARRRLRRGARRARVVLDAARRARGRLRRMLRHARIVR